MNINSERLREHFEAMSQIGKIGDTGICRPTLSKLEKQAFELAMIWMKDAGMEARIDGFGNLVGRYKGTDPGLPVLMMGSHLDSQPYGGRYDGTAGVLAAIEVVMSMHEKGIRPRRSIDVISFADEEGWRFKKGLFGSRGILGKLEEGELQRKDEEGVSREQALREFGLDPAGFKASEYATGSIHCFLELHIEQGPVLDLANKPVGVVTGISGPLWLTVKLKGMAGHAGSVPMPLRKDALLGAAQIAVALNEIVTADPAAPTIGTVGTMQVFPGSRNIIPEEVTFTIDLRDIDMARRNKCEKELRQRIEAIVKKNNLHCEISEDTNSEPRYCAAWIQDIIQANCMKNGLDAPRLMSGPFHDALTLSYACDYGMIFVRCKDGISHNPLEYSSYDDLSMGTEVLYGTMMDILTSN